jgi:signal transduction histidine kinase
MQDSFAIFRQALTLTALMVALESSKLFSGLPPAELQMLLQAVRVLTFPAGTIVFKEGDEGNGLYLVKTGLVQVSALVNQGDRRILSRLGPGEFFGEMAVVDNEPRSATVTADVETVVYFIPRADMLRILESSPTLAINLVREFSMRLREFNRQYIHEVLQAERLTLVGRFTRSIVHDFKNPLNVIGLAADLAGMETASTEMRRMARTRIRKQVDRLSNMINELLDFTRGSDGAVILAETDFATFIAHVLDELRQELDQNSIAIVCENEPPSVRVLCDPTRLMHLFSNLIHNAVDAMPNGGKIKLRFSIDGCEVTTEMEDTGPGIPSEIIPRLFEPFATFGKAQGTGLGLSICKKIIEDHRGKIAARNQPNRGAVFMFTLPFQRR